MLLDRMMMVNPTSRLFVEDVFSTWLYTGNGSSQTITNGIDLAGKGGLVWNKARNAAQGHALNDTARGAGYFLQSNDSGTGFGPNSAFLSSFNSNGFTLGSDNTQNGNGTTMVSWTFRRAPNFFDVVTYTGTGSARTISHSLGVAPGCMIVKRTDAAENWTVYHRSIGPGGAYFLNLNNSSSAGGGFWANTNPTASVFSLGGGSFTNASGGTYVAYLFAHDPSANGIIQCGSYTGNGSSSGPTVTLGWEPQWLLIKAADNENTNWQIIDNMRGMPVGSADATLQANLSNAESSVDYVSPTATGFQVVSADANVNTNTSQYIYIAIRRGPMRTPTLGTSVFAPVTYTGNASPRTITSGFPVDLQIQQITNQGAGKVFVPRITGGGALDPTLQDPENSLYTNYLGYDNNTGINYKNSTSFSLFNAADGKVYLSYFFRRAPGFFDVVCYTRTGTITVVNHNLGVAPELIITKSRTAVSSDWWTTFNMTAFNFGLGALNYDSPTGVNTYNSNTALPSPPTASSITVEGFLNQSGNNIAYLFASCPGVSKVGSYTGNGGSQTIDCGFTTGARFFLVKRTDNTGDWWVWDSARGIVAANDPALALNSTAAQVTGTDSVDPTSVGIIVNQDATTNINVNGGTYIYLAIA